MKDLVVVDLGGRDLSAILNCYHRGEVLAYFAGEVGAAREANANDFKYWSMMCHAGERGCARFDSGAARRGPVLSSSIVSGVSSRRRCITSFLTFRRAKSRKTTR
jgi:hypothetical protein